MYWLASARDGLYNAASTMIAQVANGSAGTRVGWEPDAHAKYADNKQINIPGAFGQLFPGTFLKKATPGKAYRFPYVMVTYAF